MKNFIKWWWDNQPEKDQLNVIDGAIFIFLILVFIALATLMFIDWRLLCFGSVAVYVIGLFIGGVSAALTGYDKWMEYKQEREREETK